MPGYTHEGRRQALSISRLRQASRYMLAVGPPRSEMTPVKPGTSSRIASTSRSTELSERLWMIRPSCSVMEQKVQQLNYHDSATTEKRIILYAGMLASPY